MTDKWKSREKKRQKARFGMVVDGRATRDVLALLAQKGPAKKRKGR